MKSRRRRRAANNKPAAAPPNLRDDPDPFEDPNDRVKLRDRDEGAEIFRLLVDVLSGEMMTLADLRIRHAIQPTALGRLIQRHPGVFAIIDQGGRPYCKLLVDPVDAILSFVGQFPGHKETRQTLFGAETP